MSKHSFHIHERFFRHIWSQQYIRRSALKTADGRRLQVIHAGTLNTDSGPDFRDAVIRIGSTLYSGDVEIHRNAEDWQRHEHQEDPRYNRVILHVVLRRPAGMPSVVVRTGRAVPLLVLEPVLEESIRSLWHKTVLHERTRLLDALPCSNVNETVDAGLLGSWIRRLAVERLELKMRRFNERLRELAYVISLVSDYRDSQSRWKIQGDPDDVPPPSRELTQAQLARRDVWEQLLYEGIMEGLGYSKNQESFLRLARAVTLGEIRSRRIGQSEIHIQAFLFGAAGLLPKLTTIQEGESRMFVRDLARAWKDLKRSYRSSILHAGDWQFFPTRPSNFPTIRIAAASCLLRRILCDDLFRNMIKSLKESPDGATSLAALHRLFTINPLPYWKTHYRFNDASASSLRLLGKERIDALLTNAVIPIALLYARIFKDWHVREGALRVLESMPPPANNSISRLMETQLLRRKLQPSSAGVQQGSLQLYKFYCLEGRCEECDVGMAVLQRS